MQGVVRHNDNRFTQAGSSLERFSITVDHVDRLDDHGEMCDRAQHEADEDGLYPEVEAQVTFIGHDGDPYFLAGCLDCVRAEIAAHADPDWPTTIEMEH